MPQGEHRARSRLLRGDALAIEASGASFAARAGHAKDAKVAPTEFPPITQLLMQCRRGEPDAASRLLPLIYDQLRAIARRQLSSERSDHTLMPTELVHEAYLKLFDGVPPDSENRLHFFAIAARAMREILVDRERHRRAQKRSGGERVTLSSIDPPDLAQGVDLLALDQALNGLEQVDARKARVIELRAFAGLEFAEIAEVMGISRATLARDFRTARAWLYNALDMPVPDAPPT
jgi:RNA polymerase sigma factor (TIGR02999 family)